VVISSQSLSAIFSSAVLTGCYTLYLLSRGNIKVLFLIVMAIAFGVYQYHDILLTVFGRLISEVYVSIDKIGPDMTGRVSGSGGLRVINEINYFLYTLTISPFYGFGFDYNNFLEANDVGRSVALNAGTEIMIRGGLFGVLLVFAYLFLEKLRFRPKSNIAFIIFMTLYMASDGAILKPEYWIPLAVIFGLERHQSLVTVPPCYHKNHSKVGWSILLSKKQLVS